MKYNINIGITNPNKVTKEGKVQIILKYTYGNKSQKIYIPTSYVVSTQEIKNKQIIGKKANSLNPLIYKKILEVHKKMDEVISKNLSTEPKELKKILQGEKQYSKQIIELINYVKDIKFTNGINITNYNTLASAIRKYEEHVKKTFYSDSISQKFLNEFNAFLKNNLKLFPNTISEYFILLRRILRACNRADLIDINLDKLNFNIKRLKTEKVVFKKDEFERFLRYIPTEEEVKVYDIALIIFFAGGGVRFEDLIKIHPGNIEENTIKFRWNKNIDTVVEIFIEDNLNYLLKKYDYDLKKNLVMKRDDFNYRIKKICAKINFQRKVENVKGIINKEKSEKVELSKRISSNTFRKTAISQLAEKYNLIRVMEITGHKQIKTIQSYIASESNDVRKTVKEFSSKFDISYRLIEESEKIIPSDYPDHIDWDDELPEEARNELYRLEKKRNDSEY